MKFLGISLCFATLSYVSAESECYVDLYDPDVDNEFLEYPDWCSPSVCTIDLTDFPECEMTLKFQFCWDHEQGLHTVRDEDLECFRYELFEDGEYPEGIPYYKRYESTPFFTLFGNDGRDYFGGTPRVGNDQTLRITGYADSDCREEVFSQANNLNVIDCSEPRVLYFNTHDTAGTSSKYHARFSDGFPQETCIPPSGQIGFEAVANCCVKNVYMELISQSDDTETVVASKDEKISPYSLYGNTGDDIWGTSDLSPGSYIIKAQPKNPDGVMISWNFNLLPATDSRCSNYPRVFDK